MIVPDTLAVPICEALGLKRVISFKLEFPAYGSVRLTVEKYLTPEEEECLKTVVVWSTTEPPDPDLIEARNQVCST